MKIKFSDIPDYRTENNKVREIEKKPLKLEKSLSKLKKYYDYDDIDYRGIRDLSIDEVKEMKVKEVTLSIKEYLSLIRPYLRDIINDHKIKENGKFIQVMK